MSLPIRDDVAFGSGQTIIGDLRAARQAIYEHYPLSLRQALIDARQQLDEIANPVPVFEGDTRHHDHCATEYDAAAVPVGWVAAGAERESVEVTLPGPFPLLPPRSRPTLGSKSRSRPSHWQEAVVVRTAALRVTMFPVVDVSADVAAALRAVEEDSPPHWYAARRAVQRALARVVVVTRLRDADAYAAYCELRAAGQAIGDSPETAHAALRRAVDRMAADAALADVSAEVSGLAKAEHPRASAIGRVSHRLLARIVNDTCTLASSDR